MYTFKTSGNTVCSDKLSFCFRSKVKRVMRFNQYIAVLSDDLFLYSSKAESISISNVIYIDDDYFYMIEDGHIVAFSDLYSARRQVCMKCECLSEEFVCAMKDVSVNDLVYSNEMRVCGSGSRKNAVLVGVCDDPMHSNEMRVCDRTSAAVLVGVYDNHLVVRKNDRTFYKKKIFDGRLSYFYKKYVIVVGPGMLTFNDLENGQISTLSHNLAGYMRLKLANGETFLKVDDMLVYNNAIVCRQYRKTAIKYLMRELIANAVNRSLVYKFVYNSSLDINRLNRRFTRHLERHRCMCASDLEVCLQHICTVERRCLSSNFADFVRMQNFNLKRMTESAIIRRGVASIMEEMYLIVLFYAITGDVFFFNLMRLRFLPDFKDETANRSDRSKHVLNITYERLFFYDSHMDISRMVRRRKARKDVSYLWKIMEEKKIKFDEDDLEGKRKDAQYVRRHASLGDALVFFLSKKTGKKRLSDKLMNRNITSIGDVNDLLSNKENTLLSVLFADKVPKLSEKTRRRGFSSNGKKQFYDFYYRLVHTIKYSEVICAYTPMDDPYLELILNGFLFFNSGSHRVKKKLSRPSDCKPEEMFMSEVLRRTIDFKKADITMLMNIQPNQGNDYYYRLAGRIFYVSLWFISYCERINRSSANETMHRMVNNRNTSGTVNNGNTSETMHQMVNNEVVNNRMMNNNEMVNNRMMNNRNTSETVQSEQKRSAGCRYVPTLQDKHEFDETEENKTDVLSKAEARKNLKRKELTRILLQKCLEMEEQMQDRKCYRILFDCTLIALCIINSGTCETDILRIVRRKILETKEANFLHNRTVFFINTDEGSYATNSLIYGDILKYKMCLGTLCLGTGNYRLRERVSIIKHLIIAFYPVWPIAIGDQKDFTLCRYAIFKAIERKPVNYTYDVLYDDQYDRKFVLDVLSDYCERNNESVDRWECLIDLMLEQK